MSSRCIASLDQRKRAAERQVEALQSTTERVERLRLMQRNPILMFVSQTEDMRRDYYKDLELTVETDRGDVKICGVFGSQVVAPISTTGTSR